MKKVFITGVSGFTGGHLARRLLDMKYNVSGLVLPGESVSDLESRGMRVVRGDLTDADSLDKCLEGVDIVYHIAAVYREQNVPKSLFWDVNVDGTHHLLKEALRSRVGRFVHCSTVGVQGEIKDPPATEEAPYSPGDYYQESKRRGEELALDFFRRHDLPGVVFRPVGLYGPGDTRFLKLFRHIQKGRFRMFGSGKVLYHLTYIDDLIDGIILMGTRPGIEGEVITLAGGRYTTLNEFVRIVGEVLNVKVSGMHLPVWPLWTAGAVCELLCRPFRINPPVYRRRVDFFLKDRAFDIDKARRLLGYSPKVDLKEGLAKTAAWYKSQGLLD